MFIASKQVVCVYDEKMKPIWCNKVVGRLTVFHTSCLTVVKTFRPSHLSKQMCIIVQRFL